MTDIVERLRYCQENGLFDASRSAMTAGYGEAADTIEALRAENAKLREALKPFALCNPIERDDDWFVNELRIEYFRAAKAVLGGSDE